MAPVPPSRGHQRRGVESDRRAAWPRPWSSSSRARATATNDIIQAGDDHLDLQGGVVMAGTLPPKLRALLDALRRRAARRARRGRARPDRPGGGRGHGSDAAAPAEALMADATERPYSNNGLLIGTGAAAPARSIAALTTGEVPVGITGYPPGPGARDVSRDRVGRRGRWRDRRYDGHQCGHCGGLGGGRRRRDLPAGRLHGLADRADAQCPILDGGNARWAS